MSHIKNPEAYFHTMVKNMDKNDYRANDNFFKHIDSVGDETDIRKKINAQTYGEPDAYSVEGSFCETSVENWLLFMENERLHSALRQLSHEELRLLFLIYVQHIEQCQIAPLCGLTPSGLNKRLARIKTKLKKFYKSVNF